jgi:hypothetical protein
MRKLFERHALMYFRACRKCKTGALREYDGIEEGKILKCMNCGWYIVSPDFKDAEGGPRGYSIPGSGHSIAQIPRV